MSDIVDDGYSAAHDVLSKVDFDKEPEDVVVRVPMIQYMRPNGRKNYGAFTVRGREIGKRAQALVREGVWFEAEVLNTGYVSFTSAHDKWDEEDMAICLSSNQSEDDNQAAFEEVLRQSEEALEDE